MTEKLANNSGMTREPVMKIRRATPQEEQFGRDLQYLHGNMEHWASELGPKWVAVYREKRVAVAESIEELLDQVEAKGTPKNLVVFDQLRVT